MSENHLCKGCVDSVIVSEEVIEELVKEAAENPSEIVQDSVYEARLAACASCPSLEYGTTCAHSGSIIRYRAKFKSKDCPFPGMNKWTAFQKSVGEKTTS